LRSTSFDYKFVVDDGDGSTIHGSMHGAVLGIARALAAVGVEQVGGGALPPGCQLRHRVADS
jgi:hypothetical protein